MTLREFMLGFKAVETADADPEKTMHAQLTERDLAVITFGSMVLSSLLPETKSACQLLNEKLMQVSAGQDFLPWSNEDMEELLGG